MHAFTIDPYSTLPSEVMREISSYARLEIHQGPDATARVMIARAGEIEANRVLFDGNAANARTYLTRIAMKHPHLETCIDPGTGDDN